MATAPPTPSNVAATVRPHDQSSSSSRSARRWLLGLTATASFMVALDLLVVATALTTIQRDLGTSLGLAQWTVTVYGLSFAGLLMTGTALGDRFGRRRVFVIGLAVFAAGLSGWSGASCTANELGWTSIPVATALAGGVLLLAGFIGWQRRADTPMLPLALFRSRGFSAGTGAGILLFAALYGSVLLLAQLMQVGLGYTPMEAGLRLMAWTACLLVVAPLAGAVADRIGDRPLLVGGLALNALALAWVGWIAAPDLGYPSLVAPLVLAGIGASMAIPVVQNTVLGAVAPTWVGKASGANIMSQELGGVLGVALLVAVFIAAGGDGSPQRFLDGFAPAIGLAAALLLLAAVTALAVPRRPYWPEPSALAAATKATTAASPAMHR